MKKTAIQESSRLRTFFIELPRACGVPDELATIEGIANAGRFDLEVANPNSVFRDRPGLTTRHRMRPAFLAWQEFADQKRLAYAIDLACYAADCYKCNKEGKPHPKELVDTGARLAIVELDQPEVSALYAVSEATTQGQWA